MRVAPAFVFLWAWASSAALAQEAPAPLADTKRQLQTLKQDERVRDDTGKLGDPLRGAVPQVSAPSLGPANPPQLPKRSDADRDAERARNWLIDGYEKLSPAKSNDGRRPLAVDADLSAAPDPKDPDYFLRLYERQRAAADAARARERALAGDLSCASQANAMAPFLQDWLAGSPVKSALADVLRQNSDPATPGTARDSREDGGLRRVGERERLDAGDAALDRIAVTSVEARAAAANPYLQALSLPPGPAGTRETAPRPAVMPPPPPPARSSPAGEATPRVAAPKAPSAFSPPPSPRDEQKYFPQLKKF